MRVVAHVLRLRHVLDVVDHLAERLEHQPEICGPHVHIGRRERGIHVLARILVRALLCRADFARRVLQGPIGRAQVGQQGKRPRLDAEDGERNVVDGVEKMVERLRSGNVLEFGAARDEALHALADIQTGLIEPLRVAGGCRRKELRRVVVRLAQAERVHRGHIGEHRLGRGDRGHVEMVSQLVGFGALDGCRKRRGCDDE